MLQQHWDSRGQPSAHSACSPSRAVRVRSLHLEQRCPAGLNHHGQVPKFTKYVRELSIVQCVNAFGTMFLCFCEGDYSYSRTSSSLTETDLSDDDASTVAGNIDRKIHARGGNPYRPALLRLRARRDGLHLPRLPRGEGHITPSKRTADGLMKHWLHVLTSYHKKRPERLQTALAALRSECSNDTYKGYQGDQKSPFKQALNSHKKRQCRFARVSHVQTCLESQLVTHRCRCRRWSSFRSR